MLYVIFCMFSLSKMGFALKESPFALCVSSLKAMFSSFVVNRAFLHVSCVLLAPQILCQHQFKIANFNFGGH